MRKEFTAGGARCSRPVISLHKGEYSESSEKDGGGRVIQNVGFMRHLSQYLTKFRKQLR